MEEKLNSQFKHIDFTDEQCKLFTEIFSQDETNRKVLFYIAQCEQQNKQVTVKNICENVKIERRFGNKNHRGSVTSYDVNEGYIDRKTAEKIVDRLAYASLIYFEVKLPYKYIRLNERGEQVAMNIQKKIKKVEK
ncbi:hypothetical protein ACIQZG_22660 [Lysinibacillus sp. NPDC096418]|uniref:hypothetical protein n=1 Tax=Lysinibacillus sp. NPDC096418 TaxID=3364138 RepID=UPI00380F648C